MTEPLTDQQLIALVQEKAPDELSVEEIEQLRERLRESPQLQEVLVDQLRMESYLHHALGAVQVSVDDIVARAQDAGRKRSRVYQAAWLLGLAAVLLAVGIGFLRERGRPVDPQPEAQAGQPAAAADAQLAQMGNADLEKDSPDHGRPAIEIPVEAPAAAGMAPWRLVIEAEDFSRSNLQVDDSRFGRDIGILHSGGRAPGFVEYDIEAPRDGIYQLELRYASDEPRPLRLHVNGNLIRPDAASRDTGDWMSTSQREFVEARIRLSAGENTLVFDTEGFFPNLDKLALYTSPELTSEVYRDTGSLPLLALRPGSTGAQAESIIAAAEAGPAPWEKALAEGAAPLPFDQVAFAALPRDADEELTAARLNRWLEPAPDHAYRVQEIRIGNRRSARFEGVARLAAPWPEGTVLRLGLWGASDVKFHFWNGDSGISLQVYSYHSQHIWSAWKTTRSGASPLPETRTLVTTDSRRLWASGNGPFDLRFENGSLLMVRGDIVLLKAPMAERPDEVYLEGAMRFSEIALFRGEPFPALPENPRPIVRRLKPADPGKWTARQSLHASDELEVRADGSVTLSVPAQDQAEAADRNDSRVAAAGLSLGRYGLYEVIARVKGNQPGTGIFLGDVEGTPIHHVGFLEDVRTGLPILRHAWTQTGFERASVNGRTTEVNGAAFPWAFAGEETWLRVIVGPGGLKLWVSGDGEFWGEALPDPILPANTPFASVGLYAVRDGAPRRIVLEELEVRELSAISGLADPDLRAQMAPFLPNDRETFDGWMVRAAATRPAGVELDRWLRTCAVETLASGIPQPAANVLVWGLLESGLKVDRPAEERWRFLDEMSLIADAARTENAFTLAQAYVDLAGELAEAGDAGAYEQAASRLLRAPIWSQARTPVTPSAIVRRGLLENVFEGRWRAANQLAARLRFWMTPANPDPGWQNAERDKVWLLDWTETQAAFHLQDEGALDGATLPTRWRHPLETQLSKEAFNLMAEFESALGSRAYQDACQTISTAGISGLLGLLPDSKEPDLFVSLPRAVALAMRDHPELRETMQSEFGPVGLLRVRQAMSEANAEAIETATVQFYGTDAASEAHRWLGDRALAAGKFAQAVDHYREGLRHAPPGLRPDLLARRRLAAAMLGRLVGNPVTESVEVGGDSLSADRFERLVAELAQSHARSGRGESDELASASGLKRWPAMAPGMYAAEQRGLVDGDVGRNADATWNGQDCYGRQMSVVVQDGVMYVSNRFQVSAYSSDKAQLKWRTGLGSDMGDARRLTFVPMQPLIVDDALYVRRLAKQGVELACLDRTNGALKWRTPREIVPISDPVFSRDRLLVLVSNVVQSGQVQVDLANLHPETGALLSQKMLFRLRDEWGHFPPSQLVPAGSRLLCVSGGTVVSTDHSGNVQWMRRQQWLSPELDSRQYEQYFEPPLVIDERIWLTQPGVRSVECLELDSGREIWGRVIPDIQRILGAVEGLLIVQEQQGLVALDAASGDLVWRRKLERLRGGVLIDETHGLVVGCGVPTRKSREYAALLWIDPATGKERGRCVLTSFKDHKVFLEPMVSTGERVWIFASGADREAPREILELVPRPDDDSYGPPPSPELLAWTRETSEMLQAEVAQQLPGWRIVDWRDESKVGWEPEVLGGDPALVTRLDYPARRATLMRQVELPPGARARLTLRVGREPKRNWRLEIRVDGEAVFAEDVSEENTPDGWLERTIDLPSEGRRNFVLTALHTPSGPAEESKVSRAFWNRLAVEIEGGDVAEAGSEKAAVEQE